MNLEPLKEKIRFVKRHYFPEMVALVVIFGAVGAFASLYASTNRTNLPIPYQGRLLDSNFVPVADGTYYMKFALYTSATGTSSCVWETGSAAGGAGNCNSAINSSSTPVTVNRGNFTVLLGDDVDGNNPPLSADSFNFETNAFYLGITACGTNNSCDAQMTPRRQLGGTPYSYNADMVDGWDPSSGASGGMTLVGGYTNNAKFTLIGNTAINNTLATSSIIFMVGNSGSTTAMTILNNGMIGIGTSTPSGLLTLGDMTISTTPSLTGGFFSFASSTLNDNGTTAGGTLTNAALLSIGQGVLSSQNNSTTTNAYGLYLAGAPVNGVNTTSTNTTALYIGAGAVNGVNTPTNSYGLYVNAQTGATNNYAATFMSGAVLVNATTTFGRLSQKLEVNQAGDEGGLAINTWVNDTTAGILDFNKSKGGSVGVHSVVSDSDALGNITFRGSDGSNFQSAAGIAANMDGTPISSTSSPGRLVFLTTATSSVSMSERMRINSSGYVGIGTTTPTRMLSLTGSSHANKGISFGNFQFGHIYMEGYDTDDNEYGRLFFQPNSGAGRWVFQSGSGAIPDSEDLASSSGIIMTLQSGGKVGIGTTTPQSLLQLDTPGDGTYQYLQIDGRAGAPTGTDCDVAAETGRMFVDTTNNLLYVCNGSAWRTATLNVAP